MTIRRGIVHGPRPLGALVPAVTRATYKRHSPAAAQIMADWTLIVGEKVAAMTAPRKLDRGVLTIACSGPTAMDLHYVGVALMQRINAHLGGQPVHALRFTQAGIPRRPPPARRPPPEAAAKAEAAVADFPDGELRTALASLGRVVLGRAGKDALGRAGKDALGRAGKDALGRAGKDALGHAGKDVLGRAARAR